MLATGCASFISEPLSLFSPLCKLSYSESCNKTLTWQEGCCTASDVVVKCCCRVVLANHYYSLADRVCQLKDWLWRWLHFMWQGEEAGTAVWEHTRNQKQEQHEPHGVRNSLIVSSGDEQRTRTLATATWRNSIFQGATSLLGLGLVTPKALETQAAKGA